MPHAIVFAFAQKLLEEVKRYNYIYCYVIIVDCNC